MSKSDVSGSFATAWTFHEIAGTSQATVTMVDCLAVRDNGEWQARDGPLA
ncbi:hypothetical protein OIU35_23565 [Boseaceae bacterium BT-24-1]|nr:hypothetical protein [Boseaceae bacterium BT-24-1]